MSSGVQVLRARLFVWWTDLPAGAVRQDVQDWLHKEVPLLWRAALNAQRVLLTVTYDEFFGEVGNRLCQWFDCDLDVNTRKTKDSVVEAHYFFGARPLAGAVAGYSDGASLELYA